MHETLPGERRACYRKHRPCGKLERILGLVRDARRPAPDGEVVAFRSTGKSLLPIFLASFFVPSLALTLRRQ